MAYFIPDKLPREASRGEERTYDILKKLPDDYYVYYEPNIDNRRPDFIVIAPDLGVIVIEVKGWYIKDIVRGSDSEIVINDDGREKPVKHPLLVARGYQWRLVEHTRKHPNLSVLLQQDGPHKNHFIFPFGHFVVLSNISKDVMKNYETHDLSVIFPLKNTMTRDVLVDLENASSDMIRNVLKSYIDPLWNFPTLTSKQVDILRSIIHPEINLNYPPSHPVAKPDSIEPSSEAPVTNIRASEIKVLDKRQELNSRKIGEGHRIVCGVAGSGKTVLLLSRARWLCERYPKWNILLLCYNVVFGTYLKNQLKDCEQVQICHFDEWAKKNGIYRFHEDPQTGHIEEDDHLGQRLLMRLQDRTGDFRKFDAVLIDEAQDFSPIWFTCVLEAMKDPLDGDLLIVCDGNQGIRPIHSISWKSLGIKASGRTLHKNLDLDKNYRNTYEILKMASNFVSEGKEQTEDSFGSVPVNPETATRRGIKPVVIHCIDHKDECQQIIKLCKLLLNGLIKDEYRTGPIIPENIGILYGGLFSQDHHLFDAFISDFKQFTPVVWLNEGPDSRKRIIEPGVKVQTIHSAKGLQYRAVFVMWADSFMPHNSMDEILKKRLLYVALTRAEDFLFITYSEPNQFIDTMILSGDAELIESSEFDIITPFEQKSERVRKNYSVDNIRQKFPKAYEKWTPEEDEKLKTLFQSGQKVDQLASYFQRKEGAIKSRLTKLGIIK
jgi:hypothetical protein